MFKDALVMFFCVLSILAAFFLALLIGFDEGANYQARKDSRILNNCNELVKLNK